MKAKTIFILVIIGLLIIASASNIICVLIYENKVHKQNNMYMKLENEYMKLKEEKNLLSQSVEKYINENEEKEKIILNKDRQLKKIKDIKENKELSKNEKINYYRNIINDSN